MANANSTLSFPSLDDLEAVLAFYRQGLRILQTAASRTPDSASEQRFWPLILARFQAVIDDVLSLIARA
jgi:hypothetical protein